MAAQPRIDDASNPNPSSNESSLNSPIGNVRCCQDPGRSVNRVETNLAPCSEAYFNTDLAFIGSPIDKKVSDVVDLRPEAMIGAKPLVERTVCGARKRHEPRE